MQCRVGEERKGKKQEMKKLQEMPKILQFDECCVGEMCAASGGNAALTFLLLSLTPAPSLLLAFYFF